jgi:hypothetical protein
MPHECTTGETFLETRLHLDILPQPDNQTCGPTCLHAVYRYYGQDIPLEDLIAQSPQLDEGGTLAVLLGCDALRRGFDARMYTYNLRVFDPTWFRPDGPDLSERLVAQMEAKPNVKLKVASEAYLEYLRLGGEIRMTDLHGNLLRKYLTRGHPILTGLSATYLYQSAREFGPDCEEDDVRGYSTGHFVVLCGYDKVTRRVFVADPLLANPHGRDHYYEIELDRVICAILLGVLTYDANLLIIRPKDAPRKI